MIGWTMRARGGDREGGHGGKREAGRPHGGQRPRRGYHPHPRLRSVRGLTVGLLENTKPNSAALLAAVARELQRAHGLRASVMFTKSYFGTPAEESLIQRILHNCDFAVAGIGD